MDTRTGYRTVLSVLSVGIVLALLGGFVTAGQSPNELYETRADGSVDSQRRAVEPRNGITVITTQRGDMRDVSGEIIAFRPNGSVLYHSQARSTYWDIDPSPRGSRTVMYVATERLNKSVCGDGPLLSSKGDCWLNVVERVNLSTGAVTRLYSHRADGNRWHDVDRVNDTHLVVANIGKDSVFVVNTTSGIREWTWTAEGDFPREGGGSFGKDWTHLNDVEVLADGRIMVSLRNQDQVVFLDRDGLLSNWTLGSEDDYDVLREQHNPDYIPEDRGGPAVVVADSENNRVVEYQRVDGGERTEGSRSSSDEWTRTWTWTDPQMQWPRDADRLPNGHTLVTDTIGDRVLELDAGGDVVWSAPVDRAYEAERLGTGGESAGGPSATKAGIESRTAAERDWRSDNPLRSLVHGSVPVLVLNGLLGYFFPWWMELPDVLSVFALVGVLVVWTGLELRWSSASIAVQPPVKVEDASPVWTVALLVALAGLVYAASVVIPLL